MQPENPEQKRLKDAKSIYKICIETRNFEISQLIQRNNFFMLFQGVLFAAAMQTQSSKPIVEFVVCILGVFVSVYQLQMSSGAKYWQEWWEDRLDHYEKIIKELKKSQDEDAFDLFAVSEDYVKERVNIRINQGRNSVFTNWLIKNRFSVTRAPIKVSVVLLAAWSALALHTISIWYCDESQYAIHIKGFNVSLPEN